MNIDNLSYSINKLTEKYYDELKQCGVRCVIHRKHFQKNSSHEPHTTSNSGLFFIKDKTFYKLRLKFSPFKDDDYSCIVVRFEPLDNSVKKRFIKEYSFILKFREDVKSQKHDTDKVLSSIEKLITTTLQKLKTNKPSQICSDKFPDILRYCLQTKYDYKKEILGKSKTFWDTTICFFIILLILVLSLATFWAL